MKKDFFMFPFCARVQIKNTEKRFSNLPINVCFKQIIKSCLYKTSFLLVASCLVKASRSRVKRVHDDWISRKIHLSVSLFWCEWVKNTREKRHCQFVCTFGIKTTERAKKPSKKKKKINTNRSQVFLHRRSMWKWKFYENIWSHQVALTIDSRCRNAKCFSGTFLSK